MEAMQQNKIRPFSDARTEMVIGKVSIPPPQTKKGKKKKGGKKKKKGSAEAENTDMEEPAEEEPVEPQWQTFDDMKGAVDAGWKVRKCMTLDYLIPKQFVANNLQRCCCHLYFQPGQSFSFVVTNVKGQKILTSDDTRNARPLGLDNYI